MTSSPHNSLSPPPVQWLLTNEAPPYPELLSMQQTLQAQKQQLSALNTAIGKSPSPLPALLDEQAKLEESIEDYRVILHPLRSLPTEILHHVFLACLPTDRFPPVDPKSPPITLTRVCRVWREAALGFQELWSSVHIVNQSRQYRPDVEIVAYADAVTLWLARAGNVPLAISFYSDPYFSFHHEVEYLLTKAILNHSLSTRELHLTVSEWIMAVIVGGEAQYRRSWPLLEKLTIDMREDTRTRGLGRWISAVGDPIWKAPKLKAVVLEGVMTDVFRLPLRWTQLQELRLSGTAGKLGISGPPRRYGSANVSNMLLAARKLVSLEVSTSAEGERLADGWFGVGAGVESRDQETVLRHLTTLTLRENVSSPIQSILDHLQLPALRTLTYEFMTPQSSFPPTDEHPLVKFLQRQDQPVLIQTWNVTTTSISPLGIIECLRFMPQLETLCVAKSDGSPLAYALEADAYDVPLGDWMLEQFYLNGQASLCPRLQLMTFEYCEFTSAGFKAFVEGRQSLAVTLSGDGVPGIGFVSLRAVYVRLNRARPVFVPRVSPLPSGELAQCETEEWLWDWGVEGRIRFEDSIL